MQPLPRPPTRRSRTSWSSARATSSSPSPSHRASCPARSVLLRGQAVQLRGGRPTEDRRSLGGGAPDPPRTRAARPRRVIGDRQRQRAAPHLALPHARRALAAPHDRPRDRPLASPRRGADARPRAVRVQPDGEQDRHAGRVLAADVGARRASPDPGQAPKPRQVVRRIVALFDSFDSVTCSTDRPSRSAFPPCRAS